MKKIGRNNPCPCGSGKKYKNCCLSKNGVARDISQPQKRTAEASVDSLRGKIMRFMDREGFMDYYPAAISLYWRTLDEGVQPRAMVDNDMAGFTEWFIHDYVLPDYGKPLLSIYLESNPKLTRKELQILKDWQKTNISVCQITRLEENHGIYVEDIFTGEEFFLHDISMSRSVKQWELLVCRKIWVLNEWQVSALGTTLRPHEKKDVYDLVMSKYIDHLKANPSASLSEFLHQKGYLLRQYLITREMKSTELPRVVTSHGEEIVFKEAVYDVVEHEFVVEKLTRVPDYQVTGQTEDKDGQIFHYTFDWLERGNSSKLFEGKYKKGGISFQSYYTEGPGHEMYGVLGTLEVYPERLKLSVLGEQRLKVGKAVLEKNLKGAIKHRVDSIQTLESKMSGDRRSSETKGIDPRTRRELIQQLFDKYYKNWLDSKIFALGDKTPREAAKTEEGRRELEDLLRILEYTEHRRRASGQPEYDIAWIRKELGMVEK